MIIQLEAGQLGRQRKKDVESVLQTQAAHAREGTNLDCSKVSRGLGEPARDFRRMISAGMASYQIWCLTLLIPDRIASLREGTSSFKLFGDPMLSMRINLPSNQPR